MLIGLDFDNTIVCYDQAIAILADKLFDLPPNISRTKLGLRDYLRSENREPEWTAFQGEMYGPGMKYAEAFHGAQSVMKQLKSLGHRLVITSHRSRYPYAGTQYDLHKSARAWIDNNLLHEKNPPLVSEDINFFETRAEKIASIGKSNCEIFLDDLPEVLEDENFPKSTHRILFSPDENIVSTNYISLKAWDELPALISKLA